MDGIVLSVEEQKERFISYSRWLSNHPRYHCYTIPKEKIAAVSGNGEKEVLCYCHCGDILLTTRLAIEYFMKEGNQRIWLPGEVKLVRFINSLRSKDEVIRPFNQFYLAKMKVRDFSGSSLDSAEKSFAARKNIYGVASEAFQFFFITHYHAIDLIGNRIPFLILSGFEFLRDGTVPSILIDEEKRITVRKIDPLFHEEGFSPAFLN